MVEMLAGVLYVALVIARLVGLTARGRRCFELGDQPVGLVDASQLVVGDGAADARSFQPERPM